MVRHPLAPLALVVALSFLPTVVAPPNFPFAITIFQLAPSGGPAPAALPPGCGVTSLPSPTYVRVECTAPPGFTCDQTLVVATAGIVAISANGTPSVSLATTWVPGEFATGATGCSGGPTHSATATLPGFAYSFSPSINFGFPWVCEATFSPLATGSVDCSEWT